MPDIALGEWLPDQPRVESPGLVRCENVVPTARGYRPFPSRAQAIGKDALVGPCVGAWSGESQDGTRFILAGTETGGVSSGPAIQMIWGDGGAVWDVSPVGAITGMESDGTWSFTRVGDYLIATAATITEPLTLDVSSTPTASSNFASLSSDASKAAVCAEFKEFLILGNVIGRGANVAIGTLENGIHWSALGDPTSFPAVGTAAAVSAQSDFQSFGGEGGEVTNIIPMGEYCLIFQETQTWRMDYVGTPNIMAFRRISPDTGCVVRNGAVSAGNLVYFISEDGFKTCDGASISDIGIERVDDTFNSLFDITNARLASSAYVPRLHSVLWTVPEGTTLPSRIFGYEFELNRWYQVVGQDSYQWLFSAHALAIGGSLDDPPLSTQNADTGTDLAAANLDLLGVAEGAGVASFFDQNNQIAYYSDSSTPSTGKIETGDYEFPDRQRRLLRSIRPIWDGVDGSVTVEAAGRNYMKESPTFKGLSFDTTTGISRVRMTDRVGGRYLRACLTLSGDYEEATGFDVILADGGGSR